MAPAAPKLTNRQYLERQYLESRGWKLIGTKKTKYGHCECWDHPTADDPDHTEAGWWTKGDALAYQRMQDQAGVKPEPSDRWSV